MSYQVLARKWRPQQFSDLIGQDHVVTALTNALDANRLHHAYLFTGMRGVGKTTIARIFAKSLNCESSGVSSEPCGQCPTCQDIEAGRFFDLIEVDAASRTKVEETRELLENVPYAPASGRFKVYLIDEVHMFSNHSFNALLKTLEEPPEHVKFLLATTDPQKVPVTILSRCLQFNLKSVPDAVLIDYLGSLLAQENITAEPAALAHIARSSEGSVRDSLSLVEQAAAFGQGKVLTANVESMLGRLSSTRVLDLLETLAAGDAAGMLKQVESLAEYAPDYAQLLAELLSVLHKVALQQSADTTAPGVVDAERVLQLSKTMDAADVQLYYQIGLHGRRDMPFAPDPREALEMTLLRMIAFKPAEVPAAAAPATPGQTTTPATQKAIETRNSQPSVPQPSAATEPVTDRSAGSAVITDDPTQGAAGSAKTQTTPPAQPKPAEAPVVTLEWTAENWVGIVEQLGISGMPRQLANHCVLVSVDEGSVQLELEPEHDHLNSDRFAARLKAAIAGALGRDIQLTIANNTQLANQTSDNALATPARINEQREQDALEAAQSAIRQDPVVQSLLEKVDGVVDEASVKPIGS